MKVCKYPLELTDVQTLNLPVSGYEILGPRVQRCVTHDQIVLYVKVTNNPSEQTVPIKIYIHGTGQTLHSRASKYLGTVSTDQGALWWHVFCEYNGQELPT